MRVGTLIVVGMLALAGASCSGDDGSGGAGSSSLPPTSPAALTSAPPASSTTGAPPSTAPTPSGPSTTSTTLPYTGRPPRIPTSSRANGEQALLHLQLRYDETTGCLFSGDDLPVWPPGYTVSLDPLGVRDADGNVVATVGGPTYMVGGGFHDERSLEDQSFLDCAAAVGNSVVLVGEPQVPDPNRAAARPSAACGQDTTAPGERMVDDIDGGRYLMYLPPVYEGTVPLPLVMDLHGYGETIEIHREMSGVIAKAEERWFLVVTPQADHSVPRWDAAIGSADTAFLTAVLDRVVAEHCVDLNRVYLTGLSNGAFMASVMACQLPDRIAAIAPVAGIRDPEGCTIGDPVPVITFHGTDDSFVSYDGGLGASVADLPTDDGGTIGAGIVGGDGPTIEEIAAAWAARNGCSADPPFVEAVSNEVDRIVFPNCPSNGSVELFRVNGGGHAWPGSEFSASIEAIVGHTTMTIDATDLIWQFFDAHPRR